MSRTSNLGFGGFLIGFGAGYVLFRSIDINREIFARLTVFAGVLIIASTLARRISPNMKIGGIFGGLIGGLFLSLLFTSGLSFLSIFNSGSIGDYRAEDVINYNGALTVENVVFDISTFNGYIKLYTWDNSEYSIDVTVKARGANDKEAEDNLADFEVDFSESKEGNKVILNLEHQVSFTKTNLYSVLVTAYLPSDAVYDLGLSTSNGQISLNDLVGDVLDLSTSNGEMSFDNVISNKIIGTTSNSKITGDLESPDTKLTTSNGKIDLRLPCTLSGEYDLDTSNSAIDLKVSSSSNVGYSLDMSTSNGGIVYDLDGLEYTINQNTRKKAKTASYDDMDIQITIFGSTSNSNIDVEK
jgi:hypothetical protein